MISVAGTPFFGFLLVMVHIGGVSSFGISSHGISSVIPSDQSLSSSFRRLSPLKATISETNIDDDIPMDINNDDDSKGLRDNLKRQILQLGASYDRGFGASPRARTKMESILSRLESYNPQTNAARFIDGSGRTTTDASYGSQISPLKGNWRMVWTTASDVLLLGGNPFIAIGAIYQFIDPPVVTNVIDFFPRVQTLFPQTLSGISVPNSLARAKVTTKASSRGPTYPNRIGLNFERVELSGEELFGQHVSKLFPPLGIDLPRFDVTQDVGFFDVTYLDDELLVIRQNAPGGCFVLVQVDSEDTEP